MARPNQGDPAPWGTNLNAWLDVGHNPDGSTKAPDPIEATVTAGGANPFTNDVVIDLGRVLSAVRVTATLTAFDPDGETPGNAPGQIVADIQAIRQYADPSDTSTVTNAVSVGAGDNWILDAPYSGDGSDLPKLTHERVGVSRRYIRVRANIIDGDTFEEYAGANNPAATWAIVVYAS